MIDTWLDEFKDGWTTRDINRVMELFADNVEYWESPFKRLSSKNDLRHEWKVIENQNDIRLNLAVYSTDLNKYTVIWDLAYSDRASTTQNWAGTYLIELNEEGKCVYFRQTGEQYR